MKNKVLKIKTITSLLIVVATVALFQNCGKKQSGYQQTSNLASTDDEVSGGYIEHVDVDVVVEVINTNTNTNTNNNDNDNDNENTNNGGSGNNGGGTTAGSTSGGTTVGGTSGGGSTNGGGTVGGTTGGGSNTGGGSSNGGTPPIERDILYNFVGTSQESCSQAVQNRLGFCYKCSIGAGCGISCGKPGTACSSANPNLWGACLKEVEVSNCTIPVVVKKVCKVFSASGSETWTELETAASCKAYYQELKNNNPRINYSHVTFDGQIIHDNRRVCRIVFKNAGAASGLEVSREKCLDYYKQLKRNNPHHEIIKVIYDGKELNI